MRSFSNSSARPYGTYFLIIVISMVYAYENYISDSQGYGVLKNFFEQYGFSLSGFLGGAWWTPITSVFLHASLEHLLFNVVALFFFGRVLEKSIGAARMIFVFFMGNVAGSAFIALFSFLGFMPADVPTVGASAAVFGLMGAGMIINPFELVVHPYIIPIPFLLVALIYTLYNFSQFLIILATGAQTNISYVSHLGGIAAGAIYGFRLEGLKRNVLLIFLIFVLLLVLPGIISELEKFNYIKIFEGFLRGG